MVFKIFNIYTGFDKNLAELLALKIPVPEVQTTPAHSSDYLMTKTKT